MLAETMRLVPGNESFRDRIEYGQLSRALSHPLSQFSLIL